MESAVDVLVVCYAAYDKHMLSLSLSVFLSLSLSLSVLSLSLSLSLSQTLSLRLSLSIAYREADTHGTPCNDLRASDSKVTAIETVTCTVRPRTTRKVVTQHMPWVHKVVLQHGN